MGFWILVPGVGLGGGGADGVKADHLDGRNDTNFDVDGMRAVAFHADGRRDTNFDVDGVR
jgi:hypothetical protein